MKYVLMMMLLATFAQAEDKDPFWDEECLKEKLAACGKEDLRNKKQLTPEETKTLMCRIDAMNVCRIKGND